MNLALKSLPPEKTAAGSGLMNVSRQVGGVFGVAVIWSILDRREIYHNSIFAQSQNLDSFATKQFIARFQELFHRIGDVEDAARQKALAVLHLMVKKEAMVAAFGDCFLVAGIIFLLALVPTLMLRVSDSPG